MPAATKWNLFFSATLAMLWLHLGLNTPASADDCAARFLDLGNLLLAPNTVLEDCMRTSYVQAIATALAGTAAGAWLARQIAQAWAQLGVSTASDPAPLDGVPPERAVPFAPDAKKRFNDFDKDNKSDPNKCKYLVKFPDDGPICWSSKMAICADGPAAGPGRLSGKQLDPKINKKTGKPVGQDETAYSLPNVAKGKGLPAETVRYVVMPGGFPGAEKGDVAVVIYKGQRTTAIFGEVGPPNQIGEASCAVHEALRPSCPDPFQKRDKNNYGALVRDSSVPEDVVFVVFPHSKFDSKELTDANINDKVRERALELYDKLRPRWHRAQTPDPRHAPWPRAKD